jgi:poly-gamma-glutamate synthesis protein (capsule biosynthesis protein)
MLSNRFILVLKLSVVFLILFFILSKKEIPMQYDGPQPSNSITLFLSGDVMTGRGIDQVLPHSVDPKLYEPYVKDAREYVHLAKRKNGAFQEPVSYDYIWGDALEVWKEMKPSFKLINLETSITKNNEPWPRKGIHYRMHPLNIKLLEKAEIDYCSLGNNHILDWGYVGLKETTEVLDKAHIAHSGAGKNIREARNPAILHNHKGRILVFSYGSKTSGIPKSWFAGAERPGVNLLSDLSSKTIQQISNQINSYHQPGDIVIFSIHWGDNWGYEITNKQRQFAHQLIDNAQVDLIFGHSSHHPRGLEVYNNKLILYGAGDFINDYEGIGGHENYRSELTLMYFPKINRQSGDLMQLLMVPMEIKKFSLHKANNDEAEWMTNTLNRESLLQNERISMNKNDHLVLKP